MPDKPALQGMLLASSAIVVGILERCVSLKQQQYYLKTDLVQKRALQQRSLISTLMLSVTSRKTYHTLVQSSTPYDTRCMLLKCLNQNLLAITALNILTKVDALSNTTNSIPAQFPDLFQGLGTIKAEYDIKLKPDAKPYVLFSARRIPISLHNKVEQESTPGKDTAYLFLKTQERRKCQMTVC